MPTTTQPPPVRRASAVHPRTTVDQHAIGRVRRPPDEYDDAYTTRLPTVVRRYDYDDPYDRYPAGHPPPIAPPLPQRRSRARPAVVYWVVVLCCVTIGICLTVVIPPTWQRWSDDRTYGYPRTYQVNTMVGHGDPRYPTSHFIALNNNGLLEVIEIPGGDPMKYPPQLYRIAVLTGSGADLVPVTVAFNDINGDGKPDLMASYNGTEVILFNNGTTFVSKP